MAKAIIGYTGFVGSTLCRQTLFDEQFNSANIEAIQGKHYDLVICAGAPAAKWKANQNPAEDLANIQRLMTALKTIEADRFVLISTVDVYYSPRQVNEDSPIDPTHADAYGRHRFYLEEFISNQFNNHQIVRLPGLYGAGLKKNFIYDLIHNNCLHLTHCQSAFQFYNLERLWADLQIVIRSKISVVNFATEPVCAQDVAVRSFGIIFENVTERDPVHYDMHSKYAYLFGSATNYLSSASETFRQIQQFAVGHGKEAHA